MFYTIFAHPPAPITGAELLSPRQMELTWSFLLPALRLAIKNASPLDRDGGGSPRFHSDLYLMGQPARSATPSYAGNGGSRAGISSRLLPGAFIRLTAKSAYSPAHKDTGRFLSGAALTAQSCDGLLLPFHTCRGPQVLELLPPAPLDPGGRFMSSSLWLN